MTDSQKVPVDEKFVPFLQKVQTQARLPDIYDARDISIIIFRTMRDLMTTEASNQIASDLASSSEKPDPDEIGELWKDNNPLVAFLSKVRRPLIFDGKTFIFRVSQEAGVPRGIATETVIKAVFSAVKEELSTQRVQEIADFMPDKIKSMWNNA
ncbi:MAG: DUF2267 domain-containing protein [Trichodesmium sp. St16_bin4-tuft]|nr:DUF2267 domain-containing protein [Trichodesmium sp. MAG_R01]MDE5067854.1 DUF2267 domain-containing protein [Trichodesmium sp. St4_bin8_1]MDE5073801.1 DUF2267 domain-containing protein [Trichodesmium sp. St5_bin8]MDE5078948.1 DUF2267 domain-containing protein [Trichodesmium sp. St2_bin6]MDE5100583.1 DUF2267 domain-containing protein [Trichodesmium sp. St16_bin4-tuft]MDE5104987.1 DUF2267 domain-containing protein [Trichodesmium sp. St19_bin2]